MGKKSGSGPWWKKSDPGWKKFGSGIKIPDPQHWEYWSLSEPFRALYQFCTWKWTLNTPENTWRLDFSSCIWYASGDGTSGLCGWCQQPILLRHSSELKQTSRSGGENKLLPSWDYCQIALHPSLPRLTHEANLPAFPFLIFPLAGYEYGDTYTLGTGTLNERRF